MIHELKTWPVYFEDVWQGKKKFAVRKNDRGFEIGHLIQKKEWNPETQKYTGRNKMFKIKYILENCPGLKKGYCVLGLT